MEVISKTSKAAGVTVTHAAQNAPANFPALPVKLMFTEEYSSRRTK